MDRANYDAYSRAALILKSNQNMQRLLQGGAYSSTYGMPQVWQRWESKFQLSRYVEKILLLCSGWG